MALPVSFFIYTLFSGWLKPTNAIHHYETVEEAILPPLLSLPEEFLCACVCSAGTRKLFHLCGGSRRKPNEWTNTPNPSLLVFTVALDGFWNWCGLSTSVACRSSLTRTEATGGAIVDAPSQHLTRIMRPCGSSGSGPHQPAVSSVSCDATPSVKLRARQTRFQGQVVKAVGGARGSLYYSAVIDFAFVRPHANEHNVIGVIF